MAGHPLWRTMTSVEVDVITCANTASNRAAASVRRQQVAEMVYNVHRFCRFSSAYRPSLSRICPAGRSAKHDPAVVGRLGSTMLMSVDCAVSPNATCHSGLAVNDHGRMQSVTNIQGSLG